MLADEIEANTISEYPDTSCPRKAAHEQRNAELREKAHGFRRHDLNPAELRIRGLLEFGQIGLKTLDVLPSAGHETSSLDEDIVKRSDREHVRD